jgi:signal transduction histidine kinase
MTGLRAHLRGGWRALAAPEPDFAPHAERIRRVERDLALPIRAALILTVSWFLFFSLGIESLANTSEVALEAVTAVQRFFVAYAVANLLLGLALVCAARLPAKALQWLVFTIALLDGLFVGALTLVSDGFDSGLYWVFPALIIRNAVSMPVAPLQVVLNLLVTLGYALAGLLDLAIIRLDDPAASAELAEPFLLRVCVLLLLAACCYGVQVLLDRERQRATETREFALRQEQVRAASRLAAEIAHQIKNPLGIINNAAFNLQRALGPDAPPAAAEQAAIIREEVARSDRIVTELMGSAQLAEGHVERLDVVAELEAAVLRVFPAAAGYGTEVVRDYAPALPGLLMPRRQLGQIFDNLLQNAREAMQGAGRLTLRAAWSDREEIEVAIADDGPGILPAQQERVFEAYYTTKPRGSGLGLAIVKQNVELYGGRLVIESAAGRGATFRLWFPARSVLHLRPA